MPALPRRRRRQAAADCLAALSVGQREDLETGWPIFDGYETADDMAEVWDEFGEELLAEWIEQHPGTRPFAWWLFDHGKERPIVGDKWTAEEIERRRAESRFGFLNTSIWTADGPLQKNETEYLERCGLLSPEELARIQFDEPDDESEPLGLRISRRMCRGPRRRQLMET